MESGVGNTSRQRALSHKEYLETLKPPSPAEIERISNVQIHKEEATREKYESAQETDAAKLIQRAYRGHRERRQLNGLMLTPSTRWVEIIKEWRYRSATAPHDTHSPDDARGSHRARATSDAAQIRWRRATQIAERAGGGGSPPPDDDAQPETPSSGRRKLGRKSRETNIDNSMLLDLRYFLEMVDMKHRYGANLQVYHSEWRRSSTKQNFFEWLDRGEGKHLDLPMCHRAKLESERIRYLSKEERKDYLVQVDDEGKLRWAKNGDLITTSSEQYQDSMAGIVERGTAESTFDDEETKRRISADLGFSSKLAAVSGYFRGRRASSSSESESQSSDDEVERTQTEEDIVHQTATKDRTPRKRFHVSPATILNHLLRASVKPGTWIYVADTLGRLYVGIKSSGSFQHASFLSGARISSAGTIGIEEGQLTYLSPLSGHYRPTTKSFKAFTSSLRESGVDMSELKVSGAYAVLLGMEVYGKSKRGVGRLVHHKDGERRGILHRHSSSEKHGDTESLAPLEAATSLSAVERVEQSWEAEHEQRRRLGGLHIHRKRSSTSASSHAVDGAAR